MHLIYIHSIIDSSSNFYLFGVIAMLLIRIGNCFKMVGTNKYQVDLHVCKGINLSDKLCT